MKGLLLCPQWLYSLLSLRLQQSIWSWEIGAITEPECYVPELAQQQFFDTTTVLIADENFIKSEFGLRHLCLRKIKAPDLGICRSRWMSEAWQQQNNSWSPPEDMRRAWSCWQHAPLNVVWDFTAVLPWLQLLSQPYCYQIEMERGPLTNTVWRGEYLPGLSSQSGRWWFRGRSYDFCVLWSPEPGHFNAPAPAHSRIIFWNGSTLSSSYQAGMRGINRFLRSRDENAWAQPQPGFFQSPICWPLDIQLILRQWHELQVLLWAHKSYLTIYS